MKVFALIIFFSLILISCETGYMEKDGKWVWATYAGSLSRRFLPIEDQDFESFIVLNEYHAKDKNNVYFERRKIYNTEASSFMIISEFYAKDKNSVYFDGDVILYADPNSFVLLGYPYSRDKSHVFCGGIPLMLTEKEVSMFKVTSKEEGTGSRGKARLSFFLEFHPEYQWLDTTGIEWISYSDNGTGEVNERKFKGFIEIK
ncbi:MAG: DKNYY domain-containing protein [Candidatus Kapaibacterium sp.]|jgi:hypothetical protein